MTPEEHNKYISWTFLANGLFQGAMLLFVFVFVFAMLAAGPSNGDFPEALFVLIFGFALIINLAFLAPNFVAYYALKNRKPWARIASIVASVLAGMNVPIGTAACVYALWFFFGEEWKSVYPDVAGTNSPPRQIPDRTPANWEGSFVRQDGEVVYRPAEPPDWR